MCLKFQGKRNCIELTVAIAMWAASSAAFAGTASQFVDQR